MKIGRNDPCLCGSGKKYKKCCWAGEQAQKVEDLSYKRYRDIESQLIGRLFRHAADAFGQTSIDEAWAEFHCWDNPESYDSDSPINQIFGPYFLFSWTIDPAATECDLSLADMTVCESFMRKYRSRLSGEEQEILEAANRSVFTFYEITDVDPGEGFSLRNVFTQAELNVTERSGSKRAKKGDVVFGAMFDVNGRSQTLAMSPYILPPLAIRTLVGFRKDLQEQIGTSKLTDLHIAEFDIEMREVYFDLLEPLLNPRMPELCNTDGDPLVPQTLHFEIECPDEAFSTLRSVAAGVVSESELRSEAKIENGRVVEARIPWFKCTKPGGEPWSDTVLGTLKIAGNKLTAEVNSNKRASAIKKRIESKLGSRVRYKTKVIESVEGNMEGSRQGRLEDSAISFDQLPPEALAAVKEMADAHWAKWFDEKIPALNGKTPKQAAKTKDGRELLEALLNSYEHRSGNADDVTTNLFQPDVDQLRAKLGLR